MKFASVLLLTMVSLALGSSAASGQDSSNSTGAVPDQLAESGKVTADGHSSPYIIRRLPPSSFPDLPDTVADILNIRGCMIPQTYQAHHPENVVHASLERPGSSDWAVLCSSQGTVALLVFFGSAPKKPVTLASAAETNRLQVHDSSRVLGFNWGIDPASPQQVREAQAGLERRPALLDHDALGETLLDRRTVYHFYGKSGWTYLETPN
jgi:hypothetical protein